MISGSYISQQNYRKKKLYSDLIDNSELKGSLSYVFQNFIQNVTPDIGQTYLNLIDKIMFCKNCSIEVNKALLYDHINSEEHKNFENYFIKKCMRYCDLCDREKMMNGENI